MLIAFRFVHQPLPIGVLLAMRYSAARREERALLLQQPLVENAVRHAFRACRDASSATSDLSPGYDPRMRKLKLQMQITVDGFVAGPEGQLDWMTFEMGDKLLAFINHLTDTSDAILMGRKMTEGFVTYWEQIVTQPDNPEYEFAQKMVNLPKIVFSRTVSSMAGKNLRVENGPLVDAVNHLKSQPGKDLIVYGGATFVGSLIEHGLIDELNLFVNPIAIGEGMRVFSARTPLKLVGSTAYDSGIVVNTYAPR